MADINIEIDDKVILRALQRLAAFALPGGMRSVFVSIGAAMKTSTVLRFRDQRAPDGTAWTPSRRAKAEGGQTLRDTSRLRNSISWAASGDSVRWGTNVIYAKTHQFGRSGSEPVRPHLRLARKAFGRKLRFAVWQNVGAHARRQAIPARPFLGVSSSDVGKIYAILAEDLERAARPA